MLLPIDSIIGSRIDPMEKMREKYRDRERLSTFERVTLSISEVTDVIGEVPEVIVMNEAMFKEWFVWCRENDYDFTNVAGVEVILDKESPAPLSYIIEKNQELLKRMEDK